MTSLSVLGVKPIWDPFYVSRFALSTVTVQYIQLNKPLQFTKQFIKFSVRTKTSSSENKV